MKKYIVKKPFMCREGQFEPGHSLCVGIEVSALMKEGEYEIYLGKNRETAYQISYEKAKEVCDKYNSYTLRNGKKTFILPIFAFKVVKLKETK